jgi:hypothetical protein
MEDRQGGLVGDEVDGVLAVAATGRTPVGCRRQQLADPVGDIVEQAQDLATHARDGSVAAVRSGRNWRREGLCGGH